MTVIEWLAENGHKHKKDCNCIKYKGYPYIAWACDCGYNIIKRHLERSKRDGTLLEYMFSEVITYEPLYKKVSNRDQQFLKEF